MHTAENFAQQANKHIKEKCTKCILHTTQGQLPNNTQKTGTLTFIANQTAYSTPAVIQTAGGAIGETIRHTRRYPRPGVDKPELTGGTSTATALNQKGCVIIA